MATGSPGLTRVAQRTTQYLSACFPGYVGHFFGVGGMQELHQFILPWGSSSGLLILLQRCEIVQEQPMDEDVAATNLA